MAIPVDQTSSSSSSEHDQSNETDADYQRISHYELIPSHSPIPSNGNELNNDNSDSNQSQNGASHPSPSATTSTISYNGVEVHVFGDVDGLTTSLQTLNGFFHGNAELDTDEEEEEERKREEAETALREAIRVDVERRNAPLNPETRSAVINAMRGISLQGFRPDWADAIPEHQWVDRVRGSREVPRQS